MLNGLDLFSGIGGLSEAIHPWVRTVAYCENDTYATGVLLSRMSHGEIDMAPIWDDVTTLKGKDLPPIDIISGGFPCQDISIAGAGKGLEGKRSGLFGEIIRLSSEIRPRFIFLENVPAITFRGLDAVTREISRLRYDCRWGLLSAYDVGAPHRRERWWLLAYANSIRRRNNEGNLENGEGGETTSGVEASNTHSGNVADASKIRRNTRRDVADSHGKGLEKRKGKRGNSRQERKTTVGSGWQAGVRYDWSVEPDVGRVVNGLPFRSNRLMCLGNSVVPQCAREAFKRLMGL